MKKTLDNFNGDEAIMSYEMPSSELGTIEKLCPKYGFIKCFNKENQQEAQRIFFHYTATKQPFEDLQVGDNVLFQRSISKGKLLAVDIILQSHVEIMEGTILKMPRSNSESSGIVSYNYNEECFYLPFSKKDLTEGCKFKVKDEVTFEEYKNSETGAICATNIRKKYNKPIKVQGIVSSVKDKFGFIDRCDQVKEIYFNLSAIPNGVTVRQGMELEFQVKHLRNGKEEAVNLRVLEPGSVRFMDVLEKIIYGTLLRSPDCSSSSKRINAINGGTGTGPCLTKDVLAGNISYVCETAGISGADQCKVVQIPFGEQDKKHQYSLYPGDIVAFKIAIDSRDQLQRACDVELCLKSFPSRKEPRQLGVIMMYDAETGAGLIEPDVSHCTPQASQGIKESTCKSSRSPNYQCDSISGDSNVNSNSGTRGSDDMLVAFKAREWIPTDQPIGRFIVVSFTAMQMTRTISSGQQKVTNTALRILPVEYKSNDAKNSTADDLHSRQPSVSQMTNLKLYSAGSLRGTVQRVTNSPDELGIIVCQMPGTSTKRSIAFTSEDVVKGRLKIGDEVSFGCLDRIACQYLPPAAFNIELIQPANQIPSVNNSSFSRRHASDSHRNPEIRSQRCRTLPDDKIILPLNVFPIATSTPSAADILRGWIVILKEHFGFIETEDRMYLYKFGPGTIKKSKAQLELKVGCFIEFVGVPCSGNRPRRTVDVFLKMIESETYSEQLTPVLSKRVGVIVRPLLISENTDKENQYRGLLEDVECDVQYSYSMKSLISFRTKLNPGDRVMFNVIQLVTSDPSSCIASKVVLLRHTGRVSAVQSKSSMPQTTIVTIERHMSGGAGTNFAGASDNDNYDKEATSGLPVTFQIDSNRTDVCGDVKHLNVDDTVQIDLDLSKNSARNVEIRSLKVLFKATENNAAAPRKPFKVSSSLSATDELAPRILHIRSPRVPPDIESIGFTEQLRRLP